MATYLLLKLERLLDESCSTSRLEIASKIRVPLERSTGQLGGWKDIGFMFPLYVVMRRLFPNC